MKGARRGEKPACPYMARFSVFGVLTWPSAGLAVHGASGVACMAAALRSKPVANRLKSVSSIAASTSVSDPARGIGHGSRFRHLGQQPRAHPLSPLSPSGTPLRSEA